MRVERHAYAVPGWGTGELWTRGRVVLLHELDFSLSARAEAATAETGGGDARDRRLVPGSYADRPAVERAAPPGGASTPGVTLAAHPSRESDGFAPELCRRFAAFLEGEAIGFDDVELDLSWCTDLQRALAEALRAVPRGEVVAYGELAALAGRPRAARAAGTFCAENRFALVLPCHRVVAANGIGGYGSTGVDVKRRLLALEGVHL